MSRLLSVENDKPIAIYGAGGFGVTVAAGLRDWGYANVVFLDDNPDRNRLAFIPQFRHVGGMELLASIDFVKGHDFIIGIGDNIVRQSLYETVVKLGGNVMSFIHPGSSITGGTSIGTGCTILATAVIGPRVVMGEGCIFNVKTSIGHDCTLGNFVNVCDGVTLGGHHTIGDRAFLGMGSTIVTGISIGAEAVVGAGAVVIKDVPEGATVVGVPARIIKEKNGVRVADSHRQTASTTFGEHPKSVASRP